MPGKNRELNPSAFIAVGVCFMGSGAALSAALRQSGAGAVGISLIALGIVFMILGFNKKRELESREAGGEDDNRPPA
jgi:predicted phage tail protein